MSDGSLPPSGNENEDSWETIGQRLFPDMVGDNAEGVASRVRELCAYISAGEDVDVADLDSVIADVEDLEADLKTLRRVLEDED